MHNLQNDIDRYLSGKLTPAEMHALEKRALDDPFLADALEGGSTISSQDFIADVKNLQASINAKTNQPKSTQASSLKWPLRIAAGLLLLAASTYIIINITDDKTTDSTLALNKSKEEVQRKASTPTLSDSVSGDVMDIEEVPIQSAIEAESAKTEISARKDDQPVADSEKKQEDFLALDDSQKPQELDVAEKSAVEEVIAPDVSQREVEDEVTKKMKSSANEKEEVRRRSADVAQSSPAGAPLSTKAMPSKIIKGKVTDGDDGLPLPGVNVLVKGSSVGTVTDLNGNYQVKVSESENNMVFSFIGMEPKEVVVKEDHDESDEVNVQMAPDVSELSEVVVVGYGTGEEEEFEGTKWELTEPEGGKKEYRNYMEKNIRYPEVAIKNNVEGKVTVQFTVEPTGQLTDFRVVKSLGSGCDDEVIRLIKEGPKWRPTKRNDEPVKSKAKVKLRFELPEKKK